jgi:hypothetical protein
MFGGSAQMRLTLACGLAASVLSGCNLSEPEVRGTLPLYEPDLQAGSSMDPCLEGHWTMITMDLDIFVATLVPVPNLRVSEGSLFLNMSEGAYEYGSDRFVLHIDLGPDRYLEGAAVFLTTGGYSSDDGSLLLVNSGTQKQVTDWKAFKQGRTSVVAGGVPEFSLVPSSPLDYTCGSEELVLYMRGPTGSIPMIFKRSPM